MISGQARVNWALPVAWLPINLADTRLFLSRETTMSQYADLKAQIAKLQAQADEARRTEVIEVIEDIQRKIAEFGLTAGDLGFMEAPRRGRPPKTTRLPLPPKYQDPKSGTTWSGRGKPPKWIAGKNRDRYLISE
jgi:DNA-binding protein H-NS